MPYKIGDIVEVKSGGPRKTEFDTGEQVIVRSVMPFVDHPAYKVDRIREGEPLSRIVNAKNLVKRKTSTEGNNMASSKGMTVKQLAQKVTASKWDKSKKMGGHVGRPVPVFVQIEGRLYTVTEVVQQQHPDVKPETGLLRDVCVLVAGEEHVTD
jgi:hypothetical protein